MHRKQMPLTTARAPGGVTRTVNSLLRRRPRCGMGVLRCIHVGVGGRGTWPVKVVSERTDYVTVALVRQTAVIVSLRF